MEQVVLEAKREMMTILEEKVSRPKEKLDKVDGEPKEDMVDLDQIERNL